MYVCMYVCKYVRVCVHVQANEQCGGDGGIACEQWHIPELFEFIDIAADYFSFLDKKVTP